MSSRAARPVKSPRKGLWVRAGVVVTALLLLMAVLSGWLIVRGIQLKNDLTASAVLMRELKDQVIAGELDEAQRTLARIEEHTGRANRAGTDPVWKAAGYLPVIGPNFSAATEVAVTAEDVAAGALAPLIGIAKSWHPSDLAPVNGRVHLDPIQDISPQLVNAANTVRLSYDRLSAIDTTRLLPDIVEPLSQATTNLAEANTVLSSASSSARLLPHMLGADGERNYLLLIQNSAEVRATGGIPGAVAVLTANGGNLELTAQESASELGPFEPALIVDESQASIYSTRIGRFMQSVNLTPDFPTAARTAAMMWEREHEGEVIDGVLALDTVTLAHVLKATGPVELALEGEMQGALLTQAGLPTTLTTENVVQTMLSDVYRVIEEPKAQDDYFSAVASSVFQSLVSGEQNSDGLVEALVRSTDEGRLYLWSAHPGEQQIISATDLAGSVSGSESGGARFGAYFNDGTGAKMDYYIRRTVQLNRSCTSDDYLQYTLAVTLMNTAPSDAAVSLPAYVTGGGNIGLPAGTVQTNFMGYGPERSQLQTARLNGESVPLGSYQHGKRPVGVVTSRLAPGDEVTIEMDFTNVVQQVAPALDVTPTIQSLEDVILPLGGDTDCS